MKKSMDLTYSYGGTKEAPLVRNTVLFQYDPEVHACLQEAVLERTDALLDSLTTEFDNALRRFDDESTLEEEKAIALDIMVATVMFTTKNILVQSPSVKYALMYTRIQEIFKRKPMIAPETYAILEDLLKPVWVDLRAIDNSFAL